MSTILSYGSSSGSAVFSFFIIVVIAFAVLNFVAMWKILTKAGQPGWALFVPIYNTYILFKIVYNNGWKMLWLLIPFVNAVISIIMLIDLARSFGKSTSFGVGLIFLPAIFIPILAFGDSEYIGPQ